MRGLKLRVIIWWLSFCIIPMSSCAAFAAASLGVVGSMGDVSEKNIQFRRGQEEGAYTQEFLDEESGQGCYLSGPDIDWRGDYYFVKRDISGTHSYLYKNYAPDNKSVPFITVEGKIVEWNVTPDENTSYFYYKLEGSEGLYRLPLRQNAAGADYKIFELDESPFLFESMSMALDPNQFLLMTKHDENLKVTIGLFSFDGNTTPSKTWTCSLSPEWKDNYEPLTPEDIGYHVTYEATTGRIWLLLQGTYKKSSQQFNTYCWFFTKKIEEEGELVQYYPASEIERWEDGRFKYLSIFRYGRIITEYDGDNFTSNRVALRVFDPVDKKILQDSVNRWIDKSGKGRSLEELFTYGTSSGTRSYKEAIDAQKNIYAGVSRTSSGNSIWNSQFNRLVRFNSLDPVKQPQPNPSATNVNFTDPNNVTLSSSVFSAPSGYWATSSRWRIYKRTPGGVLSLVHDTTQTGADNTYKVPNGILEDNSEYEWQMSYDWEYSSVNETMRGATNWSELAPFTVATAAEVVTEPPKPDMSLINAIFTDPDNVMLRVSSFSGTSGSNATRSNWKIYLQTAQGTSLLIHEGAQVGSSNVYKVPNGVLMSGNTYKWQMSYDWQYVGTGGAQTGSTAWSDSVSFTVKTATDPTDPNDGTPGTSSGGSSGGCNAGAMGAVIIGLLAVVLAKKR